MGYTMIENRGVQYAVDWETVARLNSSFHRADCQWYQSTVQEMSESSWYNPFSWSQPRPVILCRRSKANRRRL